ncbi:MAG: 50S ribosomal protein L23 [Turneriella sp.]|nr:50S ribosomal protein L23 [Leptospiraceae bacterium]MCX7633502.1 50S ribosomal protein L23 [Turneriella sp.]
MSLYDVIKRPIVSEKAENLRARNCYVFEVDLAANKTLVRQAVRKIFGVTPVKVNILLERADKKPNRYTVGYTSRRKKAYVFLRKEDKIPLFEGT